MPDRFGLVEEDDIPRPSSELSENLIAFGATLRILFATHPPKEPPGYPPSRLDAATCRNGAIESLWAKDVRRAVYMACDTGAPNEAIIASYKLLFT
jgi:hypothetical protein